MASHDRRMRELAADLFDRGLGYESAAARLGIPAKAVRKWHLTYRSVGREVLLDMGSCHRKYDYDTKLAAARSVVDGGMSKPEAMAAFGVASISPLENWCRLYRAGGPEALRPKPKGRPRGAAAKPREATREEELEARVSYLEAENAYLKKLAALKAEKSLRAGRGPR